MPLITELWAWVTYDGDDKTDEGVPAYAGADGLWHPLMGADRERAESLRPEAVKTAALLGKPMKLVRSKKLEVVEVVEPPPPTTSNGSPG